MVIGGGDTREGRGQGLSQFLLGKAYTYLRFVPKKNKNKMRFFLQRKNSRGIPTRVGESLCGILDTCPEVFKPIKKKNKPKTNNKKKAKKRTHKFGYRWGRHKRRQRSRT